METIETIGNKIYDWVAERPLAILICTVGTIFFTVALFIIGIGVVTAPFYDTYTVDIVYCSGETKTREVTTILVPSKEQIESGMNCYTQKYDGFNSTSCKTKDKEYMGESNVCDITNIKKHK